MPWFHLPSDYRFMSLSSDRSGLVLWLDHLQLWGLQWPRHLSGHPIPRL